MKKEFSKKYVDGSHVDFVMLCDELDSYLYEVVGEEEQKGEYDQYNTLENIHDAVIMYDGENAIGCGSFKEYEEGVAEIKRVYVKSTYRGKGVGKELMLELEKCTREKGYQKLILETGTQLKSAQGLYQKMGYQVIENYGQYEGMESSVCMEKIL